MSQAQAHDLWRESHVAGPAMDLIPTPRPLFFYFFRFFRFFARVARFFAFSTAL